MRKCKEKLEESKSITKYAQKTGRPYLVGEPDEMVQKQIRSLSKKGSVINAIAANATAKALISKFPYVAGDIHVNSSRWAKILFARMNFVNRKKTSSKADIPDKARKEIEFLFLHEIVTKVEKHSIPPELILNIDQTPSKYLPVGNETLAPRDETCVTIEGNSDKRSITRIFAISLHGDFLPMQLMYGGKSLPRYRFPKRFLPQFQPKAFLKYQ